MTKLLELDFTSLLPEHLKKYENIKAMTKVFEDKVKEKILVKIPSLFMYSDFENMEERLLDEMAIAWHVDFYDENLDKVKKATLVRGAYISHLKKGTRSAVQAALDDVFGGIEILEWFQYGGDPYTFKLIVEDAVPSPEEINRIYEMVNHYKSARSHITGFTVSTSDQLNLGYASGSHSWGRIISSPAE